MGHPNVTGKLMEVLNMRQGQTLTREQLAALAGVTPDQTRDAMRALVEKTDGQIVVITRARAWKMLPDRVAVSPKAPADPKPIPAARTAKKATAAPDLLEVLGTTRDGGLMARSEDGRLWNAKEM